MVDNGNIDNCYVVEDESGARLPSILTLPESGEDPFESLYAHSGGVV